MIRFEQSTIEQSGHIVIDRLSLAVSAGQALAVIGRTGAGKSTLLAALAAAISTRGGDITVQGHSVRRDSAGVRRLIGYVPARLEAWPAARAADFLELFANAAGLSGTGLRRALDKSLSLAGLGGRGSQQIDQLSDGAAKRLLIARALLHDPQVLVFDDPFASLDPPDRRETERLIGDATLMGRTVIAAINAADVSDCFTHLAVLADGRITAHGPASPETFSADRAWRYRFVCRGQAAAVADTLRSLSAEPHLVDADTVDCRVAAAGPASGRLIEAVVRSGVNVESVGHHPHWAAQLIDS